MDNPATIAASLTEAQARALTTGKTPGHLLRYELADLGLVDRLAWQQAYVDGEPPLYTVKRTRRGNTINRHLQDTRHD